MKKTLEFLKQEIVLCISLLLAIISCFLVPPTMKTLGHIDFRTLALLLCLMIVVEGLNRLGVFFSLAKKLLVKIKTLRGIAITLTLLCFFASMLITNDVALITFVPFTIVTLSLTGKKNALIPIVVLETIAANLGSMLTPIGNPQNLYLFSNYEMSILSFCNAIFPYAILSLFLLLLSCFLLKPEKLTLEKKESSAAFQKTHCFFYAVLFLLSMLTVFRVLPYPFVLLICVIFVLFLDRKIFKHLDYSLLLTFVFLFIFIGNLSEIPSVSTFLKEILFGKEVLLSVLLSQIFSNVPTAILLSGFTNNGIALLIGTNLGGLGTLIASMASLISFKFIVKEKVGTAKYLLYFTILNIVFLILNLLLWFIIK